MKNFRKLLIAFALPAVTLVGLQPSPAAAHGPGLNVLLALQQDKEDKPVVNKSPGRTETTRTWRNDKGQITRQTVEVVEKDAEGKDFTTKSEQKDFEDGKVVRTITRTMSKDAKGVVTTKQTTTLNGKTSLDYESQLGPDGKLIHSTSYINGGKKDSEETANPDGTVTHVEYANGGRDKNRVWTTNPDGTTKSETDYENGKATQTTDYGPGGKPKLKETLYQPDGKGKKTETEFQSDGKSPKKVTQYSSDGKKTESETDYFENSNVEKKQTVYYPDGSKEESEWDKDRNRTYHKKTDKKGKVTAEEGTPSDSGPVHSILPDNIVPGGYFSFTVVNLAGQVVPNREVTIEGGPNGSITATTDLQGVVVAKAPEKWTAARVVLGGAGVAMLADKLFGSGGGQPTFNTGPSHAAPGSIINLRGSGFSGNAKSAVVHVGNMPAKVLASSPTALRVLVPSNAPVGETTVTYSESKNPTTSQTASFKVNIVKLRLQANSTTLHTGQRAEATLLIEGSKEPVQIYVSTAQGSTIRLANGNGIVTTSGGDNNRATIPFTAVSVGPFDIRATLPKTGETDYEKDLANAEAARRDAAGWRDSAAADSDTSVADAKRIAAGHADKAAEDWDAAAEARKHGDDKKAAAFEAAAKAREEAAKAYGSDRDPGRGAAAGKDAAAKEKAAAGGD